MIRPFALARRHAVALALAVPPLAWVLYAAERASLTTLGRDQGIFQYIAWAVRRGVRDYEGVRDVNGPLIHFIHLAFLGFGGGDEHRFRVLDLAVTFATFFAVGMALPGLTRGTRAPLAPRRTPRLATRLTWGLAASVILAAQHLTYLYWDLAQRETFCNWFVVVALAAQLTAQTPGVGSPRTRDGGLALAGLASALAWLGKPTYALFTVVAVAALLVGSPRGERRRALLAFALGAAAAAALGLAYLLRFGSLRSFLRIYLVDVPSFYRFVWPKPAAELLTIPGAVTLFVVGVAASTFCLGLIAVGAWPARALPLAAFPLVGIANVLLQRKGFPYHFHPVTLGAALQLVALVAWLDERAALAHRLRPARLLPLAAAVLLALRAGLALDGSPHVSSFWLLEKAATAELREGRDYLVYFHDRDYFPADLRDAARYLREATAPDDRVQIYGMDPYVLFLAQRLSASPYIYAYDLNADVALAGEPPLGADEGQKARIRALRDGHEQDLLSHLQREPPAAFVYFDKAPLLSAEDAAADFAAHCPTVAAWAEDRYREVVRFGNIRVSLRRDLAEPVARDATAESP